MGDRPEPVTLFRAFAETLSFPGYFGHNWDALVDCLQDPHWCGHAERGAIVIVDGADVLRGVQHLGIFFSVLCQAAWHANLRLDADGQPHDDPPRALHFVLLLDQLPADAFAAQSASGPDVGFVVADGRLTATLTGDDWPGADSADASA